MALLKKLLVDKEAPILRETALPVAEQDLGSKKIRDIILKMRKALHAEDDGVAIAAPQVGESLRIFIVSGKAIAMAHNKELDGAEELNDLVLINPEVVRVSKKMTKMEEGCLSLRWLYGEVSRHEKVTIKAFTISGEEVSIDASGLISQIFQHEIDHLNGILFTDKAENVKDLPPKEAKESESSANAKKIVFFGSSRFSELVLKELENAGYSPTLKITSAKEDLDIEKLKSIKADLFIVASFGKILPKEVLAIPTHGTLNIHPSLLPKYRGASPIQAAIMNGDKETGVSIMLLDEQMDHGPILAVKHHEISDQNYEELEKELAELGAKLLVEKLPTYLAASPDKRAKMLQEQDHLQATFTKLLSRSDGKINWNDPAEKIYNQIHALNPEPGTWTTWKSKILNIKSAELINQSPKTDAIGTVVKLGDGVAIVTSHGYLLLKTIQLEGKKVTEAKSFLNGYPDFVNSILGN